MALWVHYERGHDGAPATVTEQAGLVSLSWQANIGKGRRPSHPTTEQQIQTSTVRTSSAMRLRVGILREKAIKQLCRHSFRCSCFKIDKLSIAFYTVLPCHRTADYR